MTPYLRPQNLEEMRDVLADVRNHSPGPFLVSNFMQDLVTRVLELEQQVADLQELARRSNRVAK